jgi:hypothetical protein
MIESAEDFVRLRKSCEKHDYRRAAQEEAPMAVWMDVISRYPEMRRWVAHNKTVPLEILALLASDPDKEVRIMVAMKRKLNPEILEVLAVDEDDSIRLSVARHRKAPRTVLERLTNDPWVRIREEAEQRLTQLQD